LVPADKLEEWKEQTMAQTYQHLAEMVAANRPGTFYDLKTRVKLAENFMFHAMEPTTMDQGFSTRGEADRHGTCWIQAGHIWGMVQHPDKMARLVSQVALEGKFTTLNSGEEDTTARTFELEQALRKLTGPSTTPTANFLRKGVTGKWPTPSAARWVRSSIARFRFWVAARRETWKLVITRTPSTMAWELGT
jgi:hypothetical protein